MTDETLPPTFQDLSREGKLALLTGYYGEDRPVEFWDGSTSKWLAPYRFPAWSPSARYRFVPEPDIPDSIDWSHVADWINLLFRHKFDTITWLTGQNGGYVRADAYSSYKPGNMKSFRVKRPGT
jgi:hypothetical protein